jgi:segregation and condensation protein B
MKIESILESLLFISGEPMSFKKLAKIILQKEEELKLSAESLAKKYTERNGGLRILIKDDKIQMVTAGENSDVVESFLKADIEGELSRAALEVLSIVAYRGPITRSEIENIRGVNCSFTLRHLLIRGLAERISNPNDARAYLYRVSFDFLKNLGVERIEDLPKFKELREKELFGKINDTKETENEEERNANEISNY